MVSIFDSQKKKSASFCTHVYSAHYLTCDWELGREVSKQHVCVILASTGPHYKTTSTNTVAFQLSYYRPTSLFMLTSGVTRTLYGGENSKYDV